MRWLPILLVLAGGASAEVLEVRDGASAAWFENPTDRYGHAIMGDLPEWGRLCLENDGQVACVELPQNAVFEDLTPRLADMDGDGQREAVVVESSTSGGASLVIYKMVRGALTRIATPPIGRRNRWLAPAGIADFDGDGQLDVAYVETPHLGKTLRVWTLKSGELVQVAAASGVTNHRIGDDFITGGLRDCGAGPEMVLADANWQSVVAVRLVNKTLQARVLGRFSAGLIDRALACK